MEGPHTTQRQVIDGYQDINRGFAEKRLAFAKLCLPESPVLNQDILSAVAQSDHLQLATLRGIIGRAITPKKLGSRIQTASLLDGATLVSRGLFQDI